MIDGVNKTFQETQTYPYLDKFLSLTRRLVLKPSKDAILIIDIILTALIIYASEAFNVTILPYYIIVTVDNLLYTTIAIILATMIIPIYLKLDHTFTVENALRVFFGYVVSYSLFAFPILGLYTLGLLTRIILYVLTIPLQLLALLLYSLTYAIVTKKSILRNLTAPLITHYISSIIVVILTV